MKGFFEGSTLLKIKRRRSTVARCELCRLYKECLSPYMKPTGEGKRKILIVAEAPGKTEDEGGEPLIGKSGSYLRNILKEVGIDPAVDCLLTNSLICRPPKNATPTEQQLEYCHPNLAKTIAEYDPSVIIPIGRPALLSTLMGIWTEPLGSMTRWAGWQIPCRSLNTWICPTFHPSYVIREIDASRLGTPVKKLFKLHLKGAAQIERKPYDKVIDWRDKIDVLYDQVDIAKNLRNFVRWGGPVGIDFETDMLKPEGEEGSIVAASVSWKGKKTISFPWGGKKVFKSFKELMEAENCPKVAHNLKFEDRWNSRKGTGKIVNLAWCTMTTAHGIDNRRDIGSLSFQLFIHFGVEPYSYHISPFLEQDHSYRRNRIKEVSMADLLLYNGLDALGTIKLCQLQRRILGMKEL